jgi:pimeloyl-ACP methyl ester carboxylesterase
MERVHHHGRETAYRRADRGGEGPALLFVHGSGGDRRVWNGQLRLADEFPVVALDLSGHGDSPDIAAEPGYESLAAYVTDAVAVAEAEDVDVLVGNSLGGAVIQRALLDRDVAVEGAVLAGTGARLAVFDDLLRWLDSEFERAVEFLHGADRLFHDADEDLLDRSRAAMYDAGRAVTERDFLTCHEFDVRGDVDRIDVPTLALCGEYDRLTPPRYHEYLVDEIPDAELAIVEDAAHLAMLEQPRAFSGALVDFLDRRC